MRHFVIPDVFFKGIAEKGKLYSRLWVHWLGTDGFIDEIFESDFIENFVVKNKEVKGFPNTSEITDVYRFGVQLLQQDFKIISKKKSHKPVPKEIKIISGKTLDYLNDKVGTSFQNKGTNLQLLAARIQEGYNLTDFQKVIDNKVYDWKGSDREIYLRPLTLFSKKHFENYLNGIYGKRQNAHINEQSIRKAAEELIVIRKNS